MLLSRQLLLLFVSSIAFGLCLCNSSNEDDTWRQSLLVENTKIVQLGSFLSGVTLMVSVLPDPYKEALVNRVQCNMGVYRPLLLGIGGSLQMPLILNNLGILNPNPVGILNLHPVGILNPNPLGGLVVNSGGIAVGGGTDVNLGQLIGGVRTSPKFVSSVANVGAFGTLVQSPIVRGWGLGSLSGGNIGSTLVSQYTGNGPTNSIHYWTAGGSSVKNNGENKNKSEENHGQFSNFGFNTNILHGGFGSYDKNSVTGQNNGGFGVFVKNSKRWLINGGFGAFDKNSRTDISNEGFGRHDTSKTGQSKVDSEKNQSYRNDYNNSIDKYGISEEDKSDSKKIIDNFGLKEGNFSNNKVSNEDNKFPGGSISVTKDDHEATDKSKSDSKISDEKSPEDSDVTHVHKNIDGDQDKSGIDHKVSLGRDDNSKENKESSKLNSEYSEEEHGSSFNGNSTSNIGSGLHSGDTQDSNGPKNIQEGKESDKRQKDFTGYKEFEKSPKNNSKGEEESVSTEGKNGSGHTVENSNGQNKTLEGVSEKTEDGRLSEDKSKGSVHSNESNSQEEKSGIMYEHGSNSKGKNALDQETKRSSEEKNGGTSQVNDNSKAINGSLGLNSSVLNGHSGSSNSPSEHNKISNGEHGNSQTGKIKNEEDTVKTPEKGEKKVSNVEHTILEKNGNHSFGNDHDSNATEKSSEGKHEGPWQRNNTFSITNRNTGFHKGGNGEYNGSSKNHNGSSGTYEIYAGASEESQNGKFKSDKNTIPTENENHKGSVVNNTVLRGQDSQSNKNEGHFNLNKGSFGKDYRGNDTSKSITGKPIDPKKSQNESTLNKTSDDRPEELHSGEIKNGKGTMIVRTNGTHGGSGTGHLIFGGHEKNSNQMNRHKDSSEDRNSVERDDISKANKNTEDSSAYDGSKDNRKSNMGQNISTDSNNTSVYGLYGHQNDTQTNRGKDNLVRKHGGLGIGSDELNGFKGQSNKQHGNIRSNGKISVEHEDSFEGDDNSKAINGFFGKNETGFNEHIGLNNTHHAQNDKKGALDGKMGQSQRDKGQNNKWSTNGGHYQNINGTETSKGGSIEDKTNRWGKHGGEGGKLDSKEYFSSESGDKEYAIKKGNKKTSGSVNENLAGSGNKSEGSRNYSRHNEETRGSIKGKEKLNHNQKGFNDSSGSTESTEKSSEENEYNFKSQEDNTGRNQKDSDNFEIFGGSKFNDIKNKGNSESSGDDYEDSHENGYHSDFLKWITKFNQGTGGEKSIQGGLAGDSDRTGAGNKGGFIFSNRGWRGGRKGGIRGTGGKIDWNNESSMSDSESSSESEDGSRSNEDYSVEYRGDFGSQGDFGHLLVNSSLASLGITLDEFPKLQRKGWYGPIWRQGHCYWIYFSSQGIQVFTEKSTEESDASQSSEDNETASGSSKLISVGLKNGLGHLRRFISGRLGNRFGQGSRRFEVTRGIPRKTGILGHHLGHSQRDVKSSEEISRGFRNSHNNRNGWHFVVSPGHRRRWYFSRNFHNQNGPFKRFHSQGIHSKQSSE